MKKKYKMPTVSEFLSKKIIYDRPKKEPVWVYIEKEMQKNIAIKPYNEKVGAWLRFLRDLKFYFYCQAKRKEKRLIKEIGPSWYVEFSSVQREVLNQLKNIMHQDILEDVTRRTRNALSDLGVTLKIPKKILMSAMSNCEEDPGVFMWNLYKAVYKQSPSILRSKYDMNAMIMMSSLVFVDLKECIEELEKLTHCEVPPREEEVPQKKKYFQPKVKYGEYLQKMYVPCVKKKQKTVKEPAPIGYKFRLRNQPSLDQLCQDESFLERRKQRNTKEAEKERICTYKFWEPPSTLRNTNPKEVAYAKKLKMVKKKAKVKFVTPYKNVQCLIGNVAYAGGKPHFIISNVGILPTGYMLINSGIIMSNGEFVTSISGFWRYPKVNDAERCDITCDCMVKWEDKVMDYIEKSKCKCGHYYDFYHEPLTREEKETMVKYFYQPTRQGPLFFDEPKIFQMDPTEDFIKDTVREAVKSAASTRTMSEPTLCASGLKEKDLLAAFLADLSHTALIIPHLPDANLLNNLQEWARNRVKGKITPKAHKRMMLKSQRRWLDLKHMDFRARAYRIPFTLEQLAHINWSYRSQIQKLFLTLMEDFMSRNRLKLVEQTRLWWSTMKYDAYPSKPFLDIYFTYMPGRMKDTFLIDPYSSENTPKYGAKTCPLNF